MSRCNECSHASQLKLVAPAPTASHLSRWLERLQCPSLTLMSSQDGPLCCMPGRRLQERFYVLAPSAAPCFTPQTFVHMFPAAARSRLSWRSWTPKRVLLLGQLLDALGHAPPHDSCPVSPCAAHPADHRCQTCAGALQHSSPQRIVSTLMATL